MNKSPSNPKPLDSAWRVRALVEQERAKLEFIADAAHELRTPLAIIKGNVDLARNPKTKGAQSIEETLAAIDNEVMHLDNLLSDLTLLTTGGESHGAAPVRAINIGELVSRVARRHEAFAGEKHLSVHVGTLPEADIEGDERSIERLFSNIIANAIRYGREGGDVWVSGKSVSGHVEIDVRDNGIGISANSLPHIFERFYRAESSRSKETGGTGLGLAIVKWIAEAHGGTVTAASEEGKGSTFTVILPLAR